MINIHKKFTVKYNMIFHHKEGIRF